MFALKSLKNSLLPELPSEYQFGDYSLPIVLSARRKSIAVKQKQGQLLLEVPKAIKPNQLSQVLKDNHKWLSKRIETLEQETTPVFSGAHGDRFSLFGQEFQCQWVQNPKSELNCINNQLVQLQLCHNHFLANISFVDSLSDQKKSQLCCNEIETLFKEKANEYLKAKLDFYAQQMGLQYQSLTVKGYKSRWGSCYSDGRIQFNWRLLQAPEWVIDYVVVHELAHLVHANHSRNFWGLVERHYPRTKEAKQRIKMQGRAWIEFLQNT